MAASAIQNPTAKTASKSSKKKKAKVASDETASQVPAMTAPDVSTNGAPESNNGDASISESPRIKELQKNIRNANKKIALTAKVDGIIAENSGQTLDELVSAGKINNDQKAQALRKPGLQASVTQMEDQITEYKKIDQEYKSEQQAKQAEFEKTHTERASKEKEEAVAEAKARAEAAGQKELHDSLLLLSQFLKLAAVRRGEDADPEVEENKALEGLLAQVYSGDAIAVAHMLSLINGSSDTMTSVHGESLDVTYADIKAISIKEGQPPIPSMYDDAHEAPAIETNEYPVQSDPTIANAGLTELDAPSATATTNGHDEPSFDAGIPQNSGFGDGAANAAAESNWDNSNELSTSQEWVDVPRDPAETDTGVTATPAAPSNVQSWADDQPDSPVETSAPRPTNDGFQEIQRNRGGRGGARGGRGRGDGFQRGRGRGDGYRGRGRGGGGARGGRRSEEP